ncbi:isochorismatase family cysteine hydrolase [Paenibacillus hunanensis]|uniref:cysteine hydrolase family protein n=1 Tax=Paenibacillus hunanensis TaxID=539262 RepID=UPI002A6A6813|nr:isochorismatase family cysteine hydrolase [Paenibacillus hunanensis]WPP40635.1 isochorismatase family cysteine hydrolase [Paenibacillus hunanensis]
MKNKIKWDIQPERTAVIVVDMQNVFCKPDGALYVPRTAEIIEPIQQLTAVARAADMPVIYLRHIVRGDGSDTGRMLDMYPNVNEILKRGTPGVEIIDELTPEPGDIIVDKLFYSGFHDTDLDTILRKHDIQTLIICGTVTNVCCETTVRDGAHREYKIIFLSDANAAMDYPDMGWGAVAADDIQRMTLTVVAYEFGQVSPTAQIVEEIATKAVLHSNKV